MKNLFQKLVEVRRKADYIQKKEGLQYSYASSSAVLAKVRDAMNEEGVMVIPDTKTVTVEKIRETAKGNPEFLTKVSVEFTIIDVDNPTDRLTVNWEGHGIDSAEKGVGKAYTYAEKYFFLKLFNIPTDNLDPDEFQNEKTEQSTRAEKVELFDKATRLGKDNKEKALTLLNGRKFSALSVSELREFCLLMEAENEN